MSAAIKATPKGKATPKAKVLANGKGKGGTNVVALIEGLTLTGRSAVYARNAVIVRELELGVVTRKDVIAATGMNEGNLSKLVKRFKALPAKGAARRNIMAIDVSLIKVNDPATFTLAATAGKVLADKEQAKKSRAGAPNKNTGQEPKGDAPKGKGKDETANPLAVTGNYTASARQTARDVETGAAFFAWIMEAPTVRFPIAAKVVADAEAAYATLTAQADAA